MDDTRPILIVPYMWIGDFVRCHTVVRVLNQRFPKRPVDLLATRLTAQLTEFMPGVRGAVPAELPRSRLALAQQRELAGRLRERRYGTALIMPGTWKSALAPFFAGIPERIGWFAEARWLLLNDLRWGARRLPRMVDRCAALALPAGAAAPSDWPAPELRADPAEVRDWRAHNASDCPAVALCPGAIGPGKQWPVERYGELARRLTADGIAVWVTGSPAERPLAQAIAAAGGALVRDFTGPLREAVLMLSAARAVVANDSGLLHIAAALGTPSIGIFAPTDPRLWGPLNPFIAVEPETQASPRRIADVTVAQVERATRAALSRAHDATQ
ncbi:MAG: lipopolysaccharide heptosyltransferase II [Variibacter sp.]|nr:lipopolysaccharide heptosyltransferase II [Variibacter sp.]